MSKRHITRDPGEARRKRYEQLEESGQSMEAIWEAFELLASNGHDLGPKVQAVLTRRKEIKAAAPKSSLMDI